nr:retrovirus-related Pol polyprotein from transposon TNT 1-94 [Tanacetum cinerariifolium]
MRNPIARLRSLHLDFQENFDDEVDKRSSEEYLRDLDVEYQKRAMLANSKRFIKKETTSQDEEEVSDDEEVTQVKVLMALADDELTVEESHAQNGEWVDITIRKVNTLLSIYEDVDWQNYLKYYQEMVPKTKDWVERLNPDSKLPNFNTGRILVPESQAVNESLETLNTPESSKDSKAEFLTPLPPLKNLQEASPSSEILKEKAKPFLPCIHNGFNDHRPNDYRNYVCGSYDHSTLGHYHVIHIRGSVLAESSQSNESSIRFIQRINLAQHVKKGSTIELHSKLNKTSPSGSVCIFFIWMCLDQKKSQAPEMIMSFIRMVENQNDVKVKQIRTNNGTEFRNHKLESSCDEKGISQNFSSSYTPEQNGYSSISKAFRVYNTKRQQIEETYHVTFDESMEAIRDPHIELVDIIGNPGEGMLTRSMAAKLTAAPASECLFADFLSEIEPKKVFEALKHPGWIDAMQRTKSVL